MNTTSARAAIFARLRDACGGLPAADIAARRAALGSAPDPYPDEVPLAELFLCNVLRNHGTADVAPDRVAAVSAVGTYLYATLRTHRLVAGSDARLAAMPWRDAGVLPRFGSVENAEPAVVSFARLGVAELGATVCFADRANPARNGLLPEHHLVLVDMADLVATAEAAWARIEKMVQQRGWPRGILFIAGPSSTADIEGQLVYGAHGPRHWHVILQGGADPDILERARRRAGLGDQEAPHLAIAVGSMP